MNLTKLTQMLFTIILLSGLLTGFKVFGQAAFTARQGSISRELSFENFNRNSRLILKNINGNVRVEGYDGNTVQLEVRYEMKAASNSARQQAMEESRLITRNEGNVLMIYVDRPGVKAELEGRKLNFQMNSPKNDDYQIVANFQLKVPRQIQLRASTVNHGDVELTNLAGSYLEASNVNGNVRATNIRTTRGMRTVNGNIEVIFSGKPSEDAHFNSVNGNISMVADGNAGMKVHFTSMNGDLYTDYPESKTSLDIDKSTSREGKGRYKMNGNTQLQIAKGGPLLRINTLNGNAYIKQKK